LYKVSLSPNSFDDIRQYYFDLKKAMNLQRKFPTLPRNTIQNFLQTKREISKSVNTEFDLTYINSPTPVGSYDPDKAGSFIVSNNAASNDCVRCICGTSEDGGQMILCDSCRFWLHTECLDNIDPEKKVSFFSL
jgi:hypothetical protein